MRNRSVPADVILPHLVYRDVAAAIDWLTRVFVFVKLTMFVDDVDAHFGSRRMGAVAAG